MEATKKLCCMLFLRAFKQQADCCFQYLPDDKEQRKQLKRGQQLLQPDTQLHVNKKCIRNT